MSVFFDDANDSTIQPGSGSELRLLAVVNERRAEGEWYCVAGRRGGTYSRGGHFRVDAIWPKSWLSHKKSKNERSLEEYQARIRSLWGGKEDIREIVLV